MPVNFNMNRFSLRAGPSVGLVVLGGDNVSPLVEIGLTDLPKTGAPAPPLSTALVAY